MDWIHNRFNILFFDKNVKKLYIKKSYCTRTNRITEIKNMFLYFFNNIFRQEFCAYIYHPFSHISNILTKITNDMNNRNKL